jgi:hypothetical protein
VALCEHDLDSTRPPALMALLGELVASAFAVSDEISTTYFTHSGETNHSVGT